MHLGVTRSEFHTLVLSLQKIEELNGNGRMEMKTEVYAGGVDGWSMVVDGLQ